MIEVRSAVEQAIKYLRELPTSGTNWPQAVTLEEVELTSDDRYWLITLSFKEQLASGLLGPTKYKVFTVDATTGQVRAMKIRELSA